MSIDPRVALQTLVSALEEHLSASASRRGDDDPAVENAYLAIADAFESYEEALFDAYNEVTPLVIYDEDDEDEDFSDESDGGAGESDDDGDDLTDAPDEDDDGGAGLGGEDDLEVTPNR